MGKRKRDELPDVLHMQPPEHADGDEVRPFTFQFASNCDFNLDPNFTSRVYTHKEDEEQRIIHSSMNKAEFVGKTQGEEYGGSLPCRYAIGVLDRTTGKMQMMEIETGHLIYMHAWEPPEDPETAQRNAEIFAAAPIPDLRSSQAKAESAKKKRRQEAKERLVVKEDQLQDDPADMRELFDKALREREVAKAPSLEEMLRQAHENRVIPPHHKDATKPFEAYRLEEMVSRDSYKALDTVVRQLQQGIDDDEYREGTLRANFMLPPYVLDKLPMMKNMISEAFQRRLKHLALVGALMQMYDAPVTIRNETKRAGGLNNISKKLNIPVPMLEFFLKTFYSCDREGTLEVWVRSDTRKRFMMLYIMVAAVLAEDGELSADSFDALRGPYRIERAEYADTYRELGCECNPAKSRMLDDFGKPMKTFTVSLLPAKTGTPKTLREYFPPLKLGGRKRK